MYYNGMVYVSVENGSYGTNSCGGPSTFLMLIVDPTTDQGKTAISLAMAAQAEAVEVYAAGNSDCTTSGAPSEIMGETINTLGVE